MRYPAKTILRIVFPIFVFLISNPVLAQEQQTQVQPNGDQPPEAKQEVTESVPNLADIIPKAAKLSGDLASLENRVAVARDISEFEKKFAQIEENLEGPAAELQQIKDSKAGKLNKFYEINANVVSTFGYIDRVFNPKEFLKNIKSILLENGLLFVTTSSISGFDLQVLWQNSKSIFPPDRINLFSIEGNPIRD